METKVSWRFVALLAGMLITLAPADASAHALLLSVQGQGEGIVGQAFYSDGTPAVDERVEFFTPVDAREPTDIAQTGKDGRFRLTKARDGVYNVVAYGMEGHRAEAAVSIGAAVKPDADGAGTVGANDISLIRQDIARMEARIKLADIVGGIGYIVGIAGGVMFWLSRRPKIPSSRES